MMAVSVGTMIEQLDGLQGTEDLTQWEKPFVHSIVVRYINEKKSTEQFSAKQVETIERIWAKHFAG